MKLTSYSVSEDRAPFAKRSFEFEETLACKLMTKTVLHVVFRHKDVQDLLNKTTCSSTRNATLSKLILGMATTDFCNLPVAVDLPVGGSSNTTSLFFGQVHLYKEDTFHVLAL